MSEDEQRQHLHLIDTSESLTLDELRELKKNSTNVQNSQSFHCSNTCINSLIWH